ncbi:hypothetical protein SteCoe_29941 [Stentor coeruleus]|uniref:Uncharacterized protein n=1 Tax=Stentor coeruleus TaxID=5963 RepID=A0A1R2B4Q5_9CILI|nr:hypothetical protein SteCoe_29941 [Stentor coeruleus]
MAKSKKIYTIAQALEYVENKFSRAARIPLLIGYRSSDTCKSFKTLITLCNSMSIVFLQYDMHKEAFLMLQKAVQVDSELGKFGNSEDILWQGRLVTYNSLALLFHKLGRYKDSLKLLLQAENFLINLTESRIIPHADIEISVNMLIFITLWKVKRYKEAQVYLERSAKIINYIITGIKVSHISKVSAKNLYGIIVMGLASMKCVLESDPKSAVKMCKNAVKQLEGSHVLSRPLIFDLIQHIKENGETLYNFPKISQVEFRPGLFQIFNSTSSTDEFSNFRTRNVGDWLVTDKYEKVLFITTFVISPTTPWIDTYTLERAQLRKNESISQGNEEIIGKNKKAKTVMRRTQFRAESTPRSWVSKEYEYNYSPNHKISYV